MRTEKKLANGNVLVCWDVIHKLCVRSPGGANKENYETLIKVDTNTNSIVIDKEIAEAYAINIVIKEGN